MPERKKTVLRNIFVLVYAITTISGIAIGYFIYKDVKQDLYKDLAHTSSVIKSYYDLSFKQWELSLFTVGKRISEITGENQKQQRLDYANLALEAYDHLLAFGYTDPSGQVLVFTGMGVNDSLPHLMKSENSRRSFIQAKNARRLTIGEVYFFPPVDDWILPIRVPIRNNNGELIAINTSAINYKALIEELSSFGIDKNYHIHLVNDTFSVTQLYFPQGPHKLETTLRQPAQFYLKRENQLSAGENIFFTALDKHENYNIIGVQTKLTGLNHSLYVTVGESVLWNAFLNKVNIVVLSYVILCMGFALLYAYSKNKQKEYLSAVEAERANLKALFESTNSLIALFDTKQCIVEYNSSFEERGVEVENKSVRKGMHIRDLVSDQELGQRFINLQKRALAGENFKETIEYPTTKGSLFFTFSYSPIYTGDNVTGVSMFVDDITELKTFQRKLQEYNELLEEKVKDRTAEIQIKNKDLEEALHSLKETQGQLIQIEKMASLGILAAGIGHEINNPLNFIKNGVNTMIKALETNYPAINKEAEPFLKIVNEGVERASNIVKSLSHFSRTGASMDEDCNIHDILDNCLVILQSQFKLRIEVIKSYTESPCKVKGNDGKLHQAFLNILTNAGQAITGNGTITIVTEFTGKKIRIRIKDTGMGIAKENIKRITDPFYTTKPPGEGTGLGMFLTHSIIQEHNGTIYIESELGKGTEFIVTL